MSKTYERKCEGCKQTSDGYKFGDWTCKLCGHQHLRIEPHEGPQTVFLTSCADIALYGGSAGGGKSHALLMDPLRWCIGADANKNFNGLILRKTFSQIENPGGLRDASERLYTPVGGNFVQTFMRWDFPSGASIKFGHLEHKQDKINYQGAEIPWIAWDELTHFEEEVFWYLLSRNRSTTGVPSRMRATCNPDAGSWVADIIQWWVDPDTGYPIPERSGILRWFVRIDNHLHWGDTPEEMEDRFPGNVPKSFTFIPSNLTDNPTLMDADPSYKASLLALPRVDRERLLHGNWLVTSTAGAEWEEYPHYFERHIWTKAWPEAFEASAMFCDPSKGKTDKSDYSAIVFVGLSGGKLWIKSDIRRRPAEVITSDFVRLYHEWKPTFAGMEGNVFQDLFDPLIDKECQARHISPLPLKLVKNSVKKEVRIKSLGPYLEKQKFLLQRDCESNKLLFGQLKDFGIAEFDDGPDALEGAIGLLQFYGVDTVDGVSDPVPLYEEDGEMTDLVYA